MKVGEKTNLGDLLLFVWCMLTLALKRFQLSADEWWAMNERQIKDYIQKIYDLSIDAGNSHHANLLSTKK